MEMKVELNWKGKEAEELILKAAHLALRDCVVNTANDAIKGSHAITGHNRRSIYYGIGSERKWAGESESDNSSRGFTAMGPGELNDLMGAVYSTSGYGGFLETGTRFSAAYPYLKPAADRNFTEEKFGERMKHYLGESK